MNRDPVGHQSSGSQGATAASPWLRAARPPAAGATPQPVGIDPAIAALLRDDDAGDDLRWPARLSPARLIRSLLLRWHWIAVALLIGALAGIAVALLGVQRQWESSVTLIMQDQAEELSVGGGQPYQTRSYSVETLVDAIKLPTSLDETLRRAGVESSRQDLAAAIDLRLAQKSDILNLKVTWSDAPQSAALANALADVFVARTGRIRQEEATEAYRRYEAQLADARRRVQQADAEILAFQLENQVTDFAEEIKARVIDLSRLQADYWTQAAEAEALGGAASDLDAVIRDLPAFTTSTLFRNPLEKRLEEYEWQLKEARTRYTSENPKVIKLERQVASLRELSDSSGPTGPEPIQSPNDLKRDLSVKLQDVRERARVAAARATGLETSISQQTDKLASLSALEKKFRQLESLQQTTRELERSLSSKMEEARVAMSATDSSLQVVERALVPAEPLPSGRRLLVIALCILGGLAGVALALAAELRDPLVRSLADVEGLAPEGPAIELEGGDSSIQAPLNALDPLFRGYRRLAGDLTRSTSPWEAVAVVSAEPGAGRSSVARGIAVALAVRGDRCLLVDADLRPDAGLRSVKATSSGPGLTSLLGARSGTQEVVGQDVIERLQSVPCGPLDPNDFESLLLLGQPELQTALAALSRDADRLVVDVPPCDSDEGAFEAAARIGVALVACRWGQTRREDVATLVGRLLSRGVNVLGVVLIGVPPERRRRYAGPPPRELLASFAAQLRRRMARTNGHA